ncbi:MAG TPA: hypothetical protein ENH23_07305, partial [candidate division Zixibacteria bacterium]|nr:hypothetical protein [candidate division Zixibacteria bacterium]
MSVKKYFSVLLFLLLMYGGAVFSYDSNQLSLLYEQLHNPVLDIENTYDISSDTIYHHDFALVLDSGRIAFFKPIQIGSDSTVFGAYFQGDGKFLFEPSVQMERDQLNRFFHSDSLNKKITEAVLFFAPQIYDSLKKRRTLSKQKISEKELKKVKKLHHRINEDTDFLYTFELLRNLTSPFGKPYLMLCMNNQSDDEYMYMFNSYLREEVRFWKYFWEPGSSFMEQINSYSQYNKDESYININGRNKEQLDVLHYNINAAINRNGVLKSKALVQANVLSGPVQLVEFNILPSITIDSIQDNSGRAVFFKRKKLDVTFKKWESNEIGLFLNEEVFYKDTLELTFYFHGEIADKNLGEYFVFAGANWYPSYGYNDRATFDLTFKTDKEYTFTSCGYLQSKKIKADTLITSWSVKPEAVNVSFNIGHFKKFLFEDKDIVPTEIYFSKELHAGFGGRTGKDMEKQVAEDIMNSMKVFNYYFGKYPFPKMSVGEILASHGEAFPGFIHLGFTTWMYTDTWGYDRLFRAHEVAHQWWGVGVGYETYHDQWLSEGFAEYSALLYYQALTDNKKFLNKLKESRNNIFSVRKYLFSSGEESGPIAMGYRTSGTKTGGDYSLIIYDKGAFVLHMLRNMMIDLKTMNEDNFLNMMREFYSTFRGKDATTQDFRRLAEKYVGISLDWFFDQWVYHNYLPEY